MLARNDEGDSAWSASGTRHDGRERIADVHLVGDVQMRRRTRPRRVRSRRRTADAADSVTGYAIEGGADASQFSIVAATGVLTFVAAPNYEAPADADGNNEYEVEVRATSGTGAREKTADQPITVTVTDEDGEAPGRARARRGCRRLGRRV